ncbi:Y-family DNA polymerase [Rubrivirga marina]|uniref:UmuC domain-containing protein n=1 Tax=Rubrivirga marina TaxID=1196024 RepID=A0A271J1E6_9BACT|nr:Y-family DNA polymerase [Rubrivirga marina]PAP77078.1 hypothetical protein BSZ37_11895 [Rubrivirga marina]
MSPASVVPLRRLVALVDCSAFYVSCERVFDPSLDGLPVAVLSNNDGCVIARSQEVKDAGVRMGEPFFKCRRELADMGARVYSSNYTLYGDMSRRVMDTLLSVSPHVVPYSIDEAFVHLPTGGRTGDALREHMEATAREIRRRVLRWTGVPVRVSVAETKTLAKAASEYARTLLKAGGEPVVCLWGHPDREAFLASLDVGDVWGVGRRWGQRLRDLGFSTAAKLAGAPDAVIRSRFNVVLLRTVHELRGTACVRDGDGPVERKTMVRSRSFGEPVEDVDVVRQAVATHAARAAEKLRREGLVAGRVGAFCTTKGFGQGPHRTGWVERDLTVASARTPDLIRAAMLALGEAFVAADAQGRTYRYRKAGVILNELRPVGTEQGALFGADERTPEWTAAQGRLMDAVDACNRRFGRRAVAFAAMGPLSALRKARDGAAGAPQWEMRRERMSPRYTTRWGEIAAVRA